MRCVYKVLLHADMPFSGPFVQEDVYAISGQRYGPYVVIEGFHSVPNMHPTPEKEFRVLRSDVSRIRLPAGERIIGFAHRHPPGLPNPSGHDIAGLLPHHIGFVWCEGDVTFYCSIGLRSAELIPRRRPVR